MFFKRRLRVLMWLAPIVLIGCGIHLMEKTPKPDVVSYNGKGYGCLSQIPPHIASYVADEMDEGQITTFVQCLQKSLTSFTQLTRGRNQSVYEAEEIRSFLQNYFLKARVITPEFMRQFMIIKQVLVGGEIDRITRPELFEAIQLLEEVRLEAIRLKPHLKYLNANLVEKQNSAELGKHLSEANAALRRSLDAFSSKLQNSTKPYALTDLVQFLKEFRQFTGWDSPQSPSSRVEQWVNLLKIFKSITVSPNHPDEIQIQDWVPLLQATSNWYSSLLDFKVGIEDKPVLKGPGLQNAIYLGQQVFEHTQSAILRQPSQTITFQQIYTLLECLHDLGFLPDEIKVDSLYQGVVALVSRVFGEPVTPPKLPEVSGLRLSALDNMKHEFDRWAYIQTTLVSQFGEMSLPQVNVPILQLPNILNTEQKPVRNYTQDSDWEEFLKVKNLMDRPLFPEDTNRVYFVPKDRKVFDRYKLRYGFYDLSVMNVLRSVIALVFRGYAQHHDSRILWDSALDETEMQEFYVDFRPIGIDLGLVDSRTVDAGTQAFKFAKLFTFDSTGYQWSGVDEPKGSMSFVESMTYFAFLYSEGQMSTDLYGRWPVKTSALPADDLLGLCPHGELDLNKIPKVNRACALNALPGLIMRHASNMPYLQTYLAGLPPEKQRRYAELLMDTVKSACSKEDLFEHNELATMVGVMHFAESLMAEYDTDGDGILTNEEVKPAVPIFTGIINMMAHDNSHLPEFMLGDDFARGAFMHILAKKEMPSSAWDLGLVWKNEALQPKLRVDRLDLAEVFKVIILKLHKPPGPDSPLFGVDMCKGVVQLPASLTTKLKNPYFQRVPL